MTQAFVMPRGDLTTSGRRMRRILEVADRAAGALGLSPGSRSAAQLVELARHRTGLTDFGDNSFEEPLEVLARSYETEANLSTFGRMAARWDTLRFLSNLLKLRAAERQNPAILGSAIEQPIFITGLPRSGTTFLHSLLTQDRENLAVRCWETIYPCGSPTAANGVRDRRPIKVERQLNTFAWLAPEIRQVHRLHADSPQECTEITAHVFQSLRFDTTHRVPTYRRWLDNAGHLAAYQFHRRFLKHLQHGKSAGRWVLKSPDHVFALDAIRDVYPDARLVFVHRNPLDVLPSVAQLTEILRRPFTNRLERSEVGEQVSERWRQGAKILVAFSSISDASSDRVAHLDFNSLVRDPLGSVAALYERFGLTFSNGFANRIVAGVAEWPEGGYRRHKPSLEDYGLNRETERLGFGEYMECFGVS
jgi:Sulfotransferase family